MHRLLNVADDPLITNQRRCSVVGHFENDVNLLSGFVGGDEAGLVFGVASADSHCRPSRVRFGILPPSKRQFVAVGIGRCGSELHRFTRLHFTRQCAVHFDDWRMVGFFELLHAPVGPCREIVLQRIDPAPLGLEIGDQAASFGISFFKRWRPQAEFVYHRPSGYW